MASSCCLLPHRQTLSLGNKGSTGAPLLFSGHGYECSLAHSEMQRPGRYGDYQLRDGREVEEGRVRK